LYWKVRKIENRRMVMRAAGKKSVASWMVLFYDSREILGEEVILVNRPLFFTPLKS